MRELFSDDALLARAGRRGLGAARRLLRGGPGSGTVFDRRLRGLDGLSGRDQPEIEYFLSAGLKITSGETSVALIKIASIV